MTDRDTEERAAYQRAVELAKDEIARLRADLAGRDQYIVQQSAALEAERAARGLAETAQRAWTEIGAKSEADAAALKGALRWRHTCEQCGGRGGYYADDGTGDVVGETCDCFIVADELLKQEHPGVALLAELEAARAVIAAMRQIDKHRVGAYETDQGSVEPCDECGEMREIAAQALASYDKTRKARGDG